jgi:hypothetical protein
LASAQAAALAAATAARLRSEALRRRQFELRQAAVQAEMLRQAALRRQAEQRRLLEIRKSRDLPTFVPSVRLDPSRVEDKRGWNGPLNPKTLVGEQPIAAARSKAYDALQKQSAAILRRPPRGIGVSMIDSPSVINRGSPGQQRRTVMVRNATKTGDWNAVLAELAGQSRRTSGRYVDRKLLEEVEKNYVAPMQAVRDEFSQLVGELQRLERGGDDEALLALVEDPDNIALYERFLQLFGDGVKPGAFTPHQEILQEISQARERAWTLQMGMGATSRGEVDRLVDRAQRGSVVRTPQLPGRGPRLIDERYQDLEFMQQVLDPDTGEMRSVRKQGMDAWLAREQSREFAKAQDAQRDQRRWNDTFSRLLDAEGMDLVGVGEGRVAFRDRSVSQLRTQVNEWLPGWKTNREGVPSRIAAAAGNPARQEQLVREFMAEASAAYDANMGDLQKGLRGAAARRAAGVAPAPVGSRGGNTNLENQIYETSYRKAKNAWLEALAFQLGKPAWGDLEQLSTTGLGGLTQVALTALSIFPALGRGVIQQGLGQGFQPHVDVRAPFLSDRPGIDLGKTADPNADSAYQSVLAAREGDDFWGALGQWGSAIRDYSQWGSGNVGGLLTSAVDPFMFVGPARFTRAGSLAMARAGGIAGVREAGAGGVRGLLSEYARYAAPRALGGAGREVVKIEMAKISLARKLGVPGAEALRMGDDEFRQLIDRVAADRTDELLKSDTLARLTQATGIEKTQLLNMVQQELPKILAEYKIFPEDPFQAAARMRSVRQAATRARSEAESAAQLARMQTERRVAMEALSGVTGRPLVAPKLTPAKLSRHEQLVSKYAESAQEYLQIAERGVKAADEIESGAALADPRRLHTLQAQLRRSAEEIQKFEDTYRLDPNGRKVLESRGIVGRHFDKLREFRGHGDPTAPSFVDQSLQQVRFDERRVKALTRSTLAQLKATPVDQPLSTELKDRLRQLELAKRGLVYERAMLDEGRTLMRPYVRKQIERVERSVTPQRVAPLAANESQLSVEIGRDFMRELSDARIRTPARLSARDAKALEALRPVLSAPLNTAAVLGEEHAKTVSRALGRPASLVEVWTALKMAQRDPLQAVEFGRALRQLNTQMVIAARRAGFDFSGMRVREAADHLWDVLRDEHSRVGVDAVGLNAYKELDEAVERALVAWRDHVAEGQIRLRERRFRPPSGPVESVFHDTDPFEVLVKQRVLAERGVSIFAYDELRGVMRRSMLRQESARGILDRATRRMVQEGIDLDEALKAERAATAREEALRNVEEFSTRPELQGLPPETRLRAFEERMMMDDLPVNPEITISPFQEQSLRLGFQEQLGFDFDDKHLIARYFRGEMDELPRGARLPREGELRTFAEAEGIPVRVVPANHPKLSAIPFGAGRAREGLDPEVQALLRKWDKQLVDAGMIDDVEDVTMAVSRRVDDELGEGAAARRGADAGRRQNAAAEARRSSRRNFEQKAGGRSSRVNEHVDRTFGWHENAAPPNWESDPRWVVVPAELVGDFTFTPEQYRRWLWDQMRASSDVRNQLATLRGKQIVYSNGPIAQILADAVEWMKTAKAREMFAPKNPHPASLTGFNGMAGTKTQKLAELAQYQEALRTARQIAGHQWRVSVPDAWLARVEAALEARRVRVTTDVYYHKAGDLKSLDQAMAWVKEQRARAAKTGRVEASSADFHRLDDWLDDEGVETIDQLLEGSRVMTKVKPKEDRVAVGRWLRPDADALDEVAERRVFLLEERVAQLKADLKNGRSRSSVGLSVQGDGVYIAEGASDVTLAHEVFHQFWDDAFNTAWVSDISDAIELMGSELRSTVWQAIRIGNAPYDLAEFAAELYALWRVGDGVGSEAVYNWSQLRALMVGDEAGAFDRLGQVFGNHAPRVVDTLAAQLRIPPLGHRARLFQWMEDNGYWSRRTGEAIRTGERVWSVVEERHMFEGFMGYTPPWTEADVLRLALNDPRLHEIMLREWGFFEDEYENLAAASGLESAQLADAVVWGKAGFSRQRTVAELRDWSIQRYGDLVSADGKTLVRMPWLMRADDEYLRWTEGFFDGVMERPMAAGDETHISQINVGSVSSTKALPEYVARVEAGEMPPLRVQRQTYIDEAGHAQIETQRWRLVDDGDEVWVNAALAVKGVDQVQIRWGFTDQLAKAPSIRRTAGMAGDAMAARDKLPQIIRDYLFDGDQLSKAGMQIDPRLVKAREVAKLREAIVKATRRRLDRLSKAGDVEAGDWLAQEQLRFAYDVTDQLLVDPVWRGILRGTPVAGAVLRVWGQFWRMLVSWQPAFPIMNLIESYGFKRLYLQIYEGGLRPLSLDADGRRLVESLRQIGAESDSIFHLSGGSPWMRVGNEYLTVAQRGSAFSQGLRELPVRISKFGEDALRLDFARRVAGDTFRTARKTGMSVENAEWLARHEAKRMVESFFAISKGRGWETALNEIVPFFSYNFKNKTLALRMMWEHPSVWVWGERIRREIEQANREQWEKDHPGVEFPEGPSASWLWWKVGDDYYKIDLSAFSDWTRAIGAVNENHTALEWLMEFVRVPHPSQLGALAMFTGGDTPWGNPGHIREMSVWADLFYWTRGIDYADPRKKRDFIQVMSQLLFFKEFGKIGAMDIKQSTFFSLRQLDPALAREYLEANPDLQLYWDSLPPKHRIKGFDPLTSIHYRQLMTEEENREYDAAFEAFDALNARLDASVAKYAAQPWSDEYKLAKRTALIARKVFLSENPILTRAWGTFMSPAEFAELDERFRVDQLADAWFNWRRPAKADFDDELEYNRALVAFNERRAAFLEANPALERRLTEGRTAVETAWRLQELHWTEMLDLQARLKIRILEEDAKGDDADRDVIDLLYRARDFAGASLDAERFGVFESPTRPGALNRIFAVLPGFTGLRYQRATPAERRQMDRDSWYANGIKDIVGRATSGKEFYDLLHQNPALLQEYWTRNPEKQAEFQANTEYVRWIGSWARSLEGRDFVGAQATWDQMPAWVKERYFARHPESGMRDGMGGGGGTAVQYKGRWFKSPESRDRYIAFIENGGSDGSFSEGFAETGGFRSADSRQRFLDGQAYYAALGTWVNMLKAQDFVAADRYFRTLPEWMREKYYAKHPDQRAKAELDSEALRYGAEYFLAQGDAKLAVLAKYPQLRAWLAEHGGEEGAMRGLVQAMYRAIPSNEPWLKRTFRERFPEVFGQAAAGERRIAKVARNLAEHPEMLPFYERALALQSSLYSEQLKLNKVAPRPWSMERKRRLAKKGKRRAARMHSEWTMHRDIRRYGSTG